MIRNYLKIALRSLFRNKSYAIINATGLAVGIAACLLIFLIVQFELSFDNFHSKKDRIHQVVSEFNYGGISYSRGAPMPLPSAIRTDYPQLEKVAGIAKTDAQVSIYDTQKQNIEKKFKDEGGTFFCRTGILRNF